jgi:hypothetical protein
MIIDAIQLKVRAAFGKELPRFAMEDAMWWGMSYAKPVRMVTEKFV